MFNTLGYTRREALSCPTVKRVFGNTRGGNTRDGNSHVPNVPFYNCPL